MGREMRLIDAAAFAEDLEPVLALSVKKGDKRGEAALRYVLTRLEAAPVLILRADPPKKKAPARKKYGRYKNVLLSDEEMEKVKAEFPGDHEARIEALSEYIEMKGDKYKSHLAVLRSWHRRDEEKKKETEPKRESSFDVEDFFAATLARYEE